MKNQKKLTRATILLVSCVALAACGKKNDVPMQSQSTTNIVSSEQQWIAGWQETSSLSGPRAGAAVVAVNGFLYVIGGVDGVNFVGTSEFAKINNDGSLGPWQQTAPLNEERGFIDAVTENGFIYVVGGGNGPNGQHLLQSVERAKIQQDGALSGWETLQTRMVMPRRCSKIVTNEHYMYALGGFAGTLLDNVERAEILPNGDLGAWSMEDARMTMPRYVNTVKASHGNAYVIGGHDQMKGVGIADVEWAVPDQQGIVKDWKATKPMQVGRYGLASAGHGDAIYVLGGLTGLEYLKSVEVSKIKAGGELSAWRWTTPLLEPRATFNAVVYDKWIYIIGGVNQDHYLNSVEFATFNDQGDIGFYGNAQQASLYQSKKDRLAAIKPDLPNQGTVKAIQHASMYSYIQVVNEQGVQWLAGPRIELQLNDRIRFSKGVSMSNFYSKELKRSFPKVLFVSKIEKE